MGLVYGKIVWLKPQEGWGFANILGTGVNVLIHPNQKCRFVWTGPAANDFDLLFAGSHELALGDELVMDARQTSKGGKAVAWAFKREWEIALLASPVRDPAETQAPRSEPATAPAPTTPEPATPMPKTGTPVTFGEMLEAFDFRFLHALLDAMEKKELSLSHLQDFIGNTPKKKRGEALWDEYRRRKAKSRDKKYGIASFIKEVLVDTGFRFEA